MKKRKMGFNQFAKQALSSSETSQIKGGNTSGGGGGLLHDITIWPT